MANMFFIIPRFNMKYISKPELSLILMNSLIVSKVYFYYIMMEWWIDGSGFWVFNKFYCLPLLTG